MRPPIREIQFKPETKLHRLKMMVILTIRQIFEAQDRRSEEQAQTSIFGFLHTRLKDDLIGLVFVLVVLFNLSNPGLVLVELVILIKVSNWALKPPCNYPYLINHTSPQSQPLKPHQPNHHFTKTNSNFDLRLPLHKDKFVHLGSVAYVTFTGELVQQRPDRTRKGSQVGVAVERGTARSRVRSPA
ncbi:hypothetical protein RND71_009696 [Anisodus tanguticus]|uniref:Uncharacterized protein n=1 Tax=Anisodus tanguticus TaxID=243964 RepID=A0AAE1SK67_9SOLA|nr:hypothetical protein RND71_009696 [Anisodus tanguticus]